MRKSWKPEGYSDVSPYVIAHGAQVVIDFLKTVFGASERRVYRTPDGALLHAEVQIGNSVVMIADGNQNWPGVPCHMHVYVQDVDAVYRKALAAGGVAVQEPKTQQGDPDKRGGVKDAAGNTWWLATQQ